MNMAGTKTISIDRAAEFLQVSRRTIYNYIRRGYLQTTRTIGGQSQRVTVESLTRVQEAARRRGERFFVVATAADKARMAAVESRKPAVQQPQSASISDILTRHTGQGLELPSPNATMLYETDAAQTASQLRLVHDRLRELSKFLRVNTRGSR
jgi:excisionase family DNA binding protein